MHLVLIDLHYFYYIIKQFVVIIIDQLTFTYPLKYFNNCNYFNNYTNIYY